MMLNDNNNDHDQDYNYGVSEITKLLKNVTIITDTNNDNNSNNSEQSLKELDILVFIQPNCPWCIKTLELLENEKQLENVTIVDVTTSQGFEISKKFDADQKPVPAFISRKNNVGTVGHRQSIKDLMDSLQPLQPLQSPQPLQPPQPPEIMDNTIGYMIFGAFINLLLS